MFSELLLRLLGKTTVLRMIGVCCLLLLMPHVGVSFSIEPTVRQRQTYDKQEMPSLLSVFATSHQNGHHLGHNVKRNEPAHPGSCKCTCETKAVATNSTPGSEGAAPLPAQSHRSYEYLSRTRRDRHSSSSSVDQYTLHRKRNMPATCTCTCETKTVSDEDTPTSAVSNQTHGHYETGDQQSDDSSQNWQNQFNEDWMNSIQDNEEQAQEEQQDTAPVSAALESDVVDNTIPESAEQYQGGWGHASRFPWKRLPDVICYRDECRSDADCCFRYNICDRSAKVCVDCWYGAACTSEQDCCHKYPHCQRATYRATSSLSAGAKDVTVGKCVDTI